MDLVAVGVLGLALGLVLGYWMALPRVTRLEKEKTLAEAQVKQMVQVRLTDWALEMAQDSRMAQARSLERLKTQDSNLEKAHSSDLKLAKARQEWEKANWKVEE